VSLCSFAAMNVGEPIFPFFVFVFFLSGLEFLWQILMVVPFSVSYYNLGLFVHGVICHKPILNRFLKLNCFFIIDLLVSDLD